MNGANIVSYMYLSMFLQIGRAGGPILPLGKQKNQASLASEWSYRFSVNKLPLSRFPLRQIKKKGLKAEARNLCVK